MLNSNNYSLQYEIYGPYYLREGLLNEGITSSLVKDGIQFLVAGAAEYGLGAVTLPAAGAGLAVGPTIETMVDSLFAAEEIKTAIDTFESIKSDFGKYKDLMSKAYESYDPSDFGSFYTALSKLVQKGFEELLSKGTKEKLDDVVEELKEVIQKIIDACIKPIKAGIKLIIPDATISLAAAVFIENILKDAAENAFSLFTKGVAKFEMLKDFLSNPKKCIDFFKDVFEQLVAMIQKGADYIEKASWMKMIMATGGSAIAIKKLGPAGLKKAADVIKKSAPTIVEMISKVLKVVLPMMVTSLALFQILIKGDYKKSEDEDEAATNESIFFKGKQRSLVEADMRHGHRKTPKQNLTHKYSLRANL